jgi:hypothetical protein
MRKLHLLALALSAVLGLVVGGWAYFAPQAFYDDFPGVLGSWIDQDGPFNEHLIRDVGAMYLALALASVAGLVWRHALVNRVLGVAWTVFGVLHFAYHVTHLEPLSTSDAIGNVVSLGVSLLLGVLLVVPARSDRRPA